MGAEPTFDALKQALCEWEIDGSLIHFSDRGVQYLALRYTKRPLDAGIKPSVDSLGDSYDNALAEIIIGLHRTELNRYSGPWRGLGNLQLSTLEWIS